MVEGAKAFHMELRFFTDGKVVNLFCERPNSDLLLDCICGVQKVLIPDQKYTVALDCTVVFDLRSSWKGITHIKLYSL